MTQTGVALNPLNPRSDQHVTSPYNFQTFSNKTGNENTQTYQGEVVTLIKQHILVTNLHGNVQQPKGRINNQSLGVTGLERFRGKEEIKGKSGRERTSRIDAKESKERT